MSNINDADAPRSAENWFLDAAIYAHDGDVEQAIAAAQRGIEALQATEAPSDGN